MEEDNRTLIEEAMKQKRLRKKVEREMQESSKLVESNKTTDKLMNIDEPPVKLSKKQPNDEVKECGK